jgi:hypothetical protein
MGKARQNKKKTAQPKSKTNALANRKINTINRKQTSIQNSTQTHTDLWKSESLQFHHRNPPSLSIQNSPIHSERTLVHKQPHGL